MHGLPRIEQCGIRSAPVECCIWIDLAADFGSGQKTAGIAADRYRCSIIGSQNKFVGLSVVAGGDTGRRSIDLIDQGLQGVMGGIDINGRAVNVETSVGHACKLRQI